MSDKPKKIELWKQKVGRTHGMITQWENSKYKNFSICRYYKAKDADEWKTSSEINVENFADVVELVKLAGEYLKNPTSANTAQSNVQDFADGDIPF